MLGFSHEWEKITENRFILEIIQQGLNLSFLVQPPLSASFLPFSLPREGNPKRVALFEEIEAMVQKEAVIPVPLEAPPGFYSSLFLVSKESGGYRPVINLKPLNRYIYNQRFKMETSRSIVKAVSPGDWAVSIDLKDAYFHVPVHPEVQHLLRFAISPTEAFQFRALPFGLCSAPRIFTMILREVAQHLHKRGIKAHFYLDDWLIRHQDPVILLEHLQYILGLAARLGWIVNLAKSDLTPSRQFIYLGLDFDTVQSVVRPTLKRVERLEGCVRLFLKRPTQPARAVLKLLGHMASLSDLTRLGRLHTRPLQMCLLGQWRPHRDNLEQPVFLDEVVTRDLLWWLSRANTRVGVPLRPRLPTVNLMTDASLQGWGACLTVGLKRSQAAGEWPSAYSGRSINSLELEAILLAVQEFADLLRGQVVLVLSDNATAVAYLSKQGGTHSARLCGLAWKLFMLAETLSLTLTVHHIPGKRNVLADALSRAKPVQTEWSLSQTLFEEIVGHLMLSPVIDLMATPLNTKLPVFICPYPDPQAQGVDALSVPWDNFRTAYIYPPTSLVRDVLTKLRDLDLTVIMIAPWWPNQSWFPDLLELSIDLPVEIPLTWNVLTQPVKGQLKHHYNPQVLNLTAWCLSGISSWQRVLTQSQRSGSVNLTEAALLRSTIRDGRSGTSGARGVEWIQRIPLRRK